jgi:transposase
VIVYGYAPTRSRAGPATFLEGYKGYLQADAYSVYDAFFKTARGMTEVGCWMHARRYFFKALEFDEPHMGPALHSIARLYSVEERAKALSLSAEQRWALRQLVSARLLGKLHQYLLELQPEVLAKSPAGAAVRYALNQWEALTRFLEDGELEIDNGATERANRDIAVAAATGHSLAATAAARRQPCCEASSLPASDAASSRLPGSATCSRASRRTPSRG